MHILHYRTIINRHETRLLLIYSVLYWTSWSSSEIKTTGKDPTVDVADASDDEEDDE